ncbi:MAG: response regulator [Rhodospirillales bacterium]|nr:response regulator [Rhodospirillales bacterium]
MNFLIVDDDADMRLTLRDMLESLGASRVWAVGDGNKALERMRALDFGRNDVVLADWNMRPMTGLELLDVVRTDRKLCQVYFVMITGDSGQERVVAARERGVNDYLIKPFEMLALRRKLGTFLPAPRGVRS